MSVDRDLPEHTHDTCFFLDELPVLDGSHRHWWVVVS